MPSRNMKKAKIPTTAPTPMATNVQSLAFFKASCAPVKSCIFTHLRALLEKMMAGMPAAQQHITVATILSIKKVDVSDCIFNKSVPFTGAAGCEGWLTVEAVPLPPTGCGLFTGAETSPIWLFSDWLISVFARGGGRLVQYRTTGRAELGGIFVGCATL